MRHLDAAWRVSIQVIEERVWGLATNQEIGDQSRDWRRISRLVDESRDWSLITSLSIPTVGHECRNAEKSLEGHGIAGYFVVANCCWIIPGSALLC